MYILCNSVQMRILLYSVCIYYYQFTCSSPHFSVLSATSFHLLHLLPSHLLHLLPSHLLPSPPLSSPLLPSPSLSSPHLSSLSSTLLLLFFSSVSSFVSVAAIPVPGQKEKVKRTISAELCALSHHLREKKSGFYRPVNKEKFLVKNNTNPVTPSAPPTISHHPPPTGTTEGEVRAAFSTAEETGSEDRQIAATQNRTESELGAVRLPQQPKTRSR